MSLRANSSAWPLFERLRSTAILTGLSVGVCLSLVVGAWLVVANRIPWLDRFAAQRNVAAAAALLVLALVPVVRFLREPGRLLVSGLLAWTLASLTYRLACLVFSKLGDRMGSFHVFVFGAVAYALAATLAWVGTLLWTMRNHPAANSR